MKKTLISTLVLAIALSVTASATVTTPPATTTATSTASTTRSQMQGLTKNKREIKRADPVCAQAALEKRDAAVVAALQKYTADWITILNTRTASQKAAFLKEGRERVNANLAATKVKKIETEKVAKTLSQSKKIAWDLFRVEIRACGMEADSSLND